MRSGGLILLLIFFAGNICLAAKRDVLSYDEFKWIVSEFKWTIGIVGSIASVLIGVIMTLVSFIFNNKIKDFSQAIYKNAQDIKGLAEKYDRWFDPGPGKVSLCDERHKSLTDELKREFSAMLDAKFDKNFEERQYNHKICKKAEAFMEDIKKIIPVIRQIKQ